MFCKKCGNKILSGNRFCTNCGVSIGNTSQPSFSYSDNIGAKWIVFSMLFALLLSPIYPLLSIPLLNDLKYALASLLSGSDFFSLGSSSFSYSQMYFFMMRINTASIKDSGSFWDQLFYITNYIPPLYIRMCLLTIVFLFPMFKSILKEDADSDRFWKNAMASGFVLGAANIVVYINVSTFNYLLVTLLRLSEKTEFGLGFQLIKASFIYIVLAAVGIGIGIYSRQQRKKIFMWHRQYNRHNIQYLQ